MEWTRILAYITKNSLLLFHGINKTDRDQPVRCRDRLGGLLRYYHQEAA
jgi:putative transposase